MEKKKNIAGKTEHALNSLDGIQRAEPRPFFFARVLAKLQKEERSYWSNIASFITKPAVVIACMGLIALLNAAALFYQNEERSNALIADQNEQAYADDYNTTVAGSSYYDENIESR